MKFFVCKPKNHCEFKKILKFKKCVEIIKPKCPPKYYDCYKPGGDIPA
jgi:hypothetical protein